MPPIQYSHLLSLPCCLRSLALKRAKGAPAYPIYHAKRFSTSKPSHSEINASPTSNLSSVNPAEVSHFNALASSWWDPHGSSRLLHLMNPLRHKFIRQCLNSDVHDSTKELNYLDIGCGGGIFAESAARLSNTSSVTAIDPTPDVIAVAQQHQRQDPLLLEPGRLNYRNTSIETLPLPTSPETAYDILTLFEVIEHIQRPSLFLRSCLEHLKPGGWLIGSTIARTNVSWFTTKLMAEDVLRLVPRGTHEWNQYIQPKELREWARAQPELDEWEWRVMGVVYVPGLGWKEMGASEEWGNYFFGVRKRGVEG